MGKTWLKSSRESQLGPRRWPFGKAAKPFPGVILGVKNRLPNKVPGTTPNDPKPLEITLKHNLDWFWFIWMWFRAFYGVVDFLTTKITLKTASLPCQKVISAILSGYRRTSFPMLRERDRERERQMGIEREREGRERDR